MKTNKKLRYYLAGIVLACICIGEFFDKFADFFLGFFAGWNNKTFEYAHDHYIFPSNIMGCVTVVLLALICIILYRRLRGKIAEPIERLAHGMKAVSKGDLEMRIPVESEFELYQIEEAFNYMAEELQKAEKFREEQKRKEQMLYSGIAHDLKTPMTMIMGYAKLLEDNIALSDEDKKRYLRTIIEQTKQANELLDSMLSYSKLNNNSYEMVLKKGNIAECLRTIAANYYSAFETAEMELDLRIHHECIECDFDDLEMRRVFQNLLSNIVKHNPPKTACIIQLERKQAASGDVVIEIVFADNGRNIDCELENKIFEDFAVGNDSRNTKNGSGLGLAICKKIIEKHEGTIRFVNEWLEGYKGFVIELPTPLTNADHGNLFFKNFADAERVKKRV